MISSNNWKLLSDMILRFNEETDLKILRSNVLHDLKHIIPYSKGLFDLSSKQGGILTFFDPVSYNIDDTFVKLYYEELEASDESDNLIFYFWKAMSSIYRDTDYLSDSMLFSSTFCKRWLKPQKIYYGVTAKIEHHNIIYGSISLWHDENTGDFLTEDCELLEELSKHLGLRIYLQYPYGIIADENNSPVKNISIIHRLSQREQEVVSLLCKGLSTKDIGNKLFISENTVKNHIYSIYKKLGVSNRIQMLSIVSSSNQFYY